MQVRCMAAVLLMVGRGQEAPEVVQRLLDIQVDAPVHAYMHMSSACTCVWRYAPNLYVVLLQIMELLMD